LSRWSPSRAFGPEEERPNGHMAGDRLERPGAVESFVKIAGACCRLAVVVPAQCQICEPHPSRDFRRKDPTHRQKATTGNGNP